MQTFEWDGMPGHVAIETITFEDLGDGRTRVVDVVAVPHGRGARRHAAARAWRGPQRELRRARPAARGPRVTGLESGPAAGLRGASRTARGPPRVRPSGACRRGSGVRRAADVDQVAQAHLPPVLVVGAGLAEGEAGEGPGPFQGPDGGAVQAEVEAPPGEAQAPEVGLPAAGQAGDRIRCVRCCPARRPRGRGRSGSWCTCRSKGVAWIRIAPGSPAKRSSQTMKKR